MTTQAKVISESLARQVHDAFYKNMAEYGAKCGYAGVIDCPTTKEVACALSMGLEQQEVFKFQPDSNLLICKFEDRSDVRVLNCLSFAQIKLADDSVDTAQALVEVLQVFDVREICQFMKMVNWKWTKLLPQGGSQHAIPSEAQFVDKLFGMMVEGCLSTHYHCSSGGIGVHFEASTNVLSVYFVVAEHLVDLDTDQLVY